jgi:hypothetical protein
MLNIQLSIINGMETGESPHGEDHPQTPSHDRGSNFDNVGNNYVFSPSPNTVSPQPCIVVCGLNPSRELEMYFTSSGAGVAGYHLVRRQD